MHIHTHVYYTTCVYTYMIYHICIYVCIFASSKVSSRPRVLSELEEVRCCTISGCQDMVVEKRTKNHEDNGDVMYMMQLPGNGGISAIFDHVFKLVMTLRLWSIVMQQTIRMISNHEIVFSR